MPELPEVETVCRALSKHLLAKVITDIQVRQPRLRNLVDEEELNKVCKNKTILNLRRRAKYILVDLNSEDALLLHLGMTGKFRVVKQSEPFLKHEHVIVNFEDGESLRYEDPRRFGIFKSVKVPVQGGMPESLESLGPEPLTEDFYDSYLFKKSRKKTKPIKNFIMDNAVVVGVGNIYAAEALCHHIKEVLTEAIKAGGTTISDFQAPDGTEGYFFRELAVYGREEEPCLACTLPIRRIVQAGRSTFYCKSCQK
ncbi:MAG: Fpg/Nei family DNA glycosylase [Lentisphaeraceae bacterium]|nr:Fpg/Nei family DNA glycosylase [Lentisphaeraceae bacterium]